MSPIDSKTSSTPANLEAGNANSSQSTTLNQKITAIANITIKQLLSCSIGSLGLGIGIAGIVVYALDPTSKVGTNLALFAWPTGIIGSTLCCFYSICKF